MVNEGRRGARRRTVVAESVEELIRVRCLHCGSEVAVVNGQWLREIRQAAGVTLREAARRFDRSAAYLSDVELGQRRATDAIVGAYQVAFRRPR